jgi:hypothetical protein
VFNGAKNRPIVVDRRRNVAESEAREFPFEIRSEKNFGGSLFGFRALLEKFTLINQRVTIDERIEWE